MDELRPEVTYVTPTRRLAHHLRGRHDEACLARGLQTWPTPDVIPWPELLRRQFDADRAAGRTTARWLSANHARLVWERLVRDDPNLPVVLSPAGLGGLAYRAWVLMHQYRVPYTALASGQSPEMEAFAGWVEAYGRWLQRGDWLDPALASGRVGPFAAGATLSFVGFDRWTPEQAAFLDRLRAAGVTVTLPVALDDDAPIRASVVECNDFEAELATAARWAARHLQEFPGSRLALIVPALDRERRRVRRVLDRVLVPGTALTGGPLP
jgi:hypothetical protein